MPGPTVIGLIAGGTARAPAAVALLAPDLPPVTSAGLTHEITTLADMVQRAGNLFKLAQPARRLGADRPVDGFFAGDGEDLIDDGQAAAACAADYAAEIRARQATGPYLVAGTRGGGVFDLATVAHLRREGAEVARLIRFDARCPDSAVPDARCSQARLAERAALRRDRHAGRLARRQPPMDERAVIVPAIDGRDAGDLPPARRRLYEYQAAPSFGPITLFLNEEWHRHDPTDGWEAVAHGPLLVERLPGRHGDQVRANVDLPATRLRATLDDVEAGTIAGGDV